MPHFHSPLRRRIALALGAAAVLAGATLAARAEICTAIRHEILTVRADRDDWTSAAISIKPNDVILVYAGGRLAIAGAGSGTVSAKGLADGTGSLEMKVGTGTVVPAGTRWFGSFRDYGTLKFRVAAAHRAELAGNFKVNLVVIPADVFPDTITLDAE